MEATTHTKVHRHLFYNKNEQELVKASVYAIKDIH